MLSILGAALGLLLAAALPYAVVEARWRWRWREVESGEVAAHQGALGVYRAEGTVPTFLRQAPPLVRWAAYTSLLFGQMFVPGLLLGSFGLLAGGIGLVSIPGLITAAKLYRSGLQLLHRDPRESYFSARSAAAWALWLNAIVFAGSLVVALAPLRPTSTAAWQLMLFINGYGLASVLQALLVLRATSRWEDALFAPSQLVRLGSTLVAADPAA
jgi:hypothetical protein